MNELIKSKAQTESSPLEGFQIEKYSAGYCVRNPKGEYLWYGSDDGEDNHYFFTDSPRRTRACEYSDTITCYSLTKSGAIDDLKKWMKQELDDCNDLPPIEIYRFK